jgi:elongation factor Ts
MSTQPANSPSPLAGALATYVHPGSKIGVLVELTCQSEFVAQREEFLQLAHDLAMHVAASDPKFLSRENISPELYRRQQEIFVDEALRAGKLPELARTVAAGQMEKFCRENCLLEQPFIKDPQISITELLDLAGQNLAESIFLHRFVRFKIGEDPVYGSDPIAGADDAGVPAPTPTSPRPLRGSAGAEPEE